MVDSATRQAILRRRMVFLSGALAAVTGCDKGTPAQPPTNVLVGEPDETSGMPTATPSSPAPAPAAKGLPPAPSTAIPATTCDGDRAALERVKSAFDALYAETDSLYQALPSACAVTDDTCLPKYRPLAKRFDEVRERAGSVLGLCGCSAPIVETYAAKHQTELNQRIRLIRERVAETAKAADAGSTRWDELVQEEATPRPCLSCVRCVPKSACD